jgi:hypothetical protein
VQRHLDVHVVLDNSATHKTPEVKAWLEKHARFKITRKRIRRDAFASVAALEAAIYDYLLHHNADPKPFVWTKTVEVILKKERRP